MEQRYLVLVDEQSQSERLRRIKQNLRNDGIDLICEEITPNDCFDRLASGDITFNKKALLEKIQSIPFLPHLDVFATDYNLVGNELKGIDVVSMLYTILPYYHGQVVIYSAQIEEVIGNIINERAGGLNEQITMLKLLTRNVISYLSSEGEFENSFKSLITMEPNITLDARLIDSLLSIDNEKFRCSIPGYTDKTVSEIGQLLANNSNETIALKKEITEQIIAYITSIQEYE